MQVLDTKYWQEFGQAAFYGVIRALSIGPWIYPLEVIKVKIQKDGKNPKVHSVVSDIFSQEGARGFYRGFSPYLFQGVIKQAWSWPVIVGMPSKLSQKTSMSSTSQQAVTGLTIALIDAGVTTPFVKMRIELITSKKSIKIVSWEFFSKGYEGFFHNLFKLSTTWPLFLVAQEKYRAAYRHYWGKKTLNMLDLSLIGCGVAATVGVVAGPADYLNTLAQTGEFLSFKEFSQNIRKAYKGNKVFVVTLCIHNVASVAMLEYISQKKS